MAFSYQHEYHAGNFADVFKHTTLILILQNLIKKDKPFTVLDAHSGAALYSLDSNMALKTEEAKGGILRLLSLYKSSPKDFPQSLLDYMNIELPFLEKSTYAGSTLLMGNFLRENDVLHSIEGHKGAFEALNKTIKENKTKGRVYKHFGDSYETVNAITPPPIKRGLILYDPSYEDISDYQKVKNSIMKVHKKWNTAIIALWYPLLSKKKNETAKMLTALEDFIKTQLMPSSSFRCEMKLYDIASLPKEMQEENAPHMYGNGMFIINPSWHLEEELKTATAFLETALKPVP